MKKLIALLFVLINVLHIVLIIMRAIYSDSPLFIDYSKHKQIALPHSFFWETLPTVLNMAIYAGMAWVLIVFREKFWITIGTIIFTVQQLVEIAVSNQVKGNVHHINGTRFTVTAFLGFGDVFIMLYMMIAMLLVSNPYIRPWFRAYVIVVASNMLLIFLSYFPYSAHFMSELGINISLTFDICFVFTLILFVRVFLLLLKDKPLVETVN